MNAPAFLKVILRDNSTQRMTFQNGLLGSINELVNEVQRQCGLNFNFRLQFMDALFGNEFMNQSSMDEVQDRGTIRINAEFKHITTMPLQSRFLSQLDVHSEKLMKLFKNRGGQMGRCLESIVAPMAEVNIFLKRVAIAIWKLATGGEYRTISHLFGVGLSTVFNCVQDFCNAVIKVLLTAHITCPDAEKLVEMAALFHSRCRVRWCNRWKPHSNYSTRGVSQRLLQPERIAYPMQSWLMKPFADNGRLTPKQHTYNSRLSSAQSVVEMAFGRLKGQCRCLLIRNDCKLDLSKKMALTCCVLHNICEEHGDNFTEVHQDRQANIQPSLHALPEYGNQEGADIRAALMAYFNRGND
ncbi:hypothetical protein ABVT39_010973 [Epinephelus coioides]